MTIDAFKLTTHWLQPGDFVTNLIECQAADTKTTIEHFIIMMVLTAQRGVHLSFGCVNTADITMQTKV